MTTRRPTLYRPAELVPVGTKAEHDRAQAKQREQWENTEQERMDRLTALKQRSGVERLRYATGWQNIDYRSVTLSIEDFEKLLARIEQP